METQKRILNQTGFDLSLTISTLDLIKASCLLSNWGTPMTQTWKGLSLAVFTVRWLETPTSITTLGISESVRSSIYKCTNKCTVNLQWGFSPALPNQRFRNAQLGENKRVNAVGWLMVYCKVSHLHSLSQPLCSFLEIPLMFFHSSNAFWKSFKIQSLMIHVTTMTS